MRKIWPLLLFLLIAPQAFARETFFPVQSIDTMKYSRDLAREKLKDSGFDTEINKQVRAIAGTGATHVAVDTPYDEEFVPILKRWVSTARKYGLKVWFRGNLSGWEGWFGYPKIDRTTHSGKTVEFILNHPDLFQDGDIFSSCPECENGGPGDPRQTGDTDGFRKYIIGEHNSVTESFKKINKKVITSYNSMNADVAEIIMDRNTTKKLGGTVAIDHYVKTPEELAEEAAKIAKQSGGKIILGEIGVPIPDINGNLSEEEQMNWLDRAFKLLVKRPEVTGLNYWTNKGGSTAIWNPDDTPRKAFSIIKKYYRPVDLYGNINDADGSPLYNVYIIGDNRKSISQNGKYALPVNNGESVRFSRKGYVTVIIKVSASNTDYRRDIIMPKINNPYRTKLLNGFFDFFLRITGL